MLAFPLSILLSQEIPDGIVNAFKKGNTKQLSGYLNNNIELKILDKEYITSKNQAVRILQEFFEQYPPVSFTTTYQNVKKDTYYGVGILKTEKEEFKVDIYFLEGRKERIIYYLSIKKNDV